MCMFTHAHALHSLKARQYCWDVRIVFEFQRLVAFIELDYHREFQLKYYFIALDASQKRTLNKLSQIKVLSSPGRRRSRALTLRCSQFVSCLLISAKPKKTHSVCFWIHRFHFWTPNIVTILGLGTQAKKKGINLKRHLSDFPNIVLKGWQWRYLH